jgi:hypothetical protein
MIRSASPNRIYILACVLGPHETYYGSTVLGLHVFRQLLKQVRVDYVLVKAYVFH